MSISLTEHDFIDLGELLASIPEEFEPMEADYLDGFLTALVCLPTTPAPSAWMPWVFDREGRDDAQIRNQAMQLHLEDLVYRRYRQIERAILRGLPVDPIIYEDEADNPQALEPFASGFLEATKRWPDLNRSKSPLVQSALIGIFRHLPPEQIGDMAQVREELDAETPLEDLESAIADLEESVKEIASVTCAKRASRKSDIR